MFKKSRLKFIIINMSLVSLVLIMIMVAVMFSKYNRLEIGSYNMLAGILYTPDKFASKYPYFPENINVNIFTAKVSVNKELINWNILYGNVDDKAAHQAIEEAIYLPDTRGKLHNQKFNYSFKKSENEIVYAFISTDYIIKILMNESFTLIIIGIASLGLFFLISLYLSSFALKPVKKIWNSQKQFYANASHELKTPISVVLANTSILLSDKESIKSDKVKWIKNIEAEMKHMSKLVEGLLFLAKSDEPRDTTPKDELNLSDIVQQCILQFEPIAYEASIAVTYDLNDKGLKILGYEDEIKQLIMILLDNAYKYGDKEISISLQKVHNKALLSVKNNGTPIPESDLAFIFDRFYRIDKSRNRNLGGLGLGLAIAKEIVRSHSGEINVRSCLEQGTIFEVKLIMYN